MKKIQRNQRGLTLVELMIAISLGMFIVLAVTRLVISSKAAQSTQDDAATIQDTARYALDNIRHSVKQAGYINFDQNDVPFISSLSNIFTENLTPSVIGFDANSLKATRYGLDSPIQNSRNSSDILALRYFGSGIPADNTVLNCAGFGVPAPTSQNSLESDRGWSIYYVANDVDHEPALFCKYKGDSNFSTQAIARGVESFQVLYGINSSSPTNGTLINANMSAHATQYLNAQQITSLDSEIPEFELNKKTHWKKITAIKVAMLIRGAENSRFESSTLTHNLFGERYGNSMGAADKGTQINEADIPREQRKRLRKVASTTIQLRNSLD